MRAINNTICLGAMLLFGCGGGVQPGSTASSTTACSPGARINCTCPDGRPSTQSCAISGKGYGECSCAMTVAAVPDPPPKMTTVTPPPTQTSVTPPANPAANGGIPGGAPTIPPNVPQMPPPQTPPTMPPAVPTNPGAAAGGMAMGPIAGMAAPTGTAGGGAPGASPGVDDALREACVAEINMYRAMRMDAPPLKRATPDQEACSDMGAKSDGDTMSPHGFFKMQGTCISKVGLSAQDSCPGYPVGGFGAATVLAALQGCLKQMWAEGEPPNGRDACTQDASGCFQKYGHWLNMSNPKATAVSCGFYQMKDGKSWWMNQDFVVSWR
jgi:hypothetical protein